MDELEIFPPRLHSVLTNVGGTLCLFAVLIFKNLLCIHFSKQRSESWNTHQFLIKHVPYVFQKKVLFVQEIPEGPSFVKDQPHKLICPENRI